MRTTFAKNLKIVQLLRGFTNKSLAEKMNVSVVTVDLHRTGRQNPNITTLTKYAKALGVRPGLLLDETLTAKIEKDLENG